MTIADKSGVLETFLKHATFEKSKINFMIGDSFSLTFNESKGSNEDNETNDVKKLLNELLELKQPDENGKETKLMKEQYLWYAVYRVLSELCKYPINRSDFQQSMKRLGMDKANPPCVYNSWRNKDVDVPKLSCTVKEWNQYRELSPVYRKMSDVANFLIDHIEGGE